MELLSATYLAKLNPTLSKAPVMLPERVVSPVMIATAMSEAMRPYSMAVAPDSSAAKRLKMLDITVFPNWLSCQVAVERCFVSIGD